MQFSKAQKILHQSPNYNPPPGYYFTSTQSIPPKIPTLTNYQFSKQQRFYSNQKNQIPGPGFYHNNKLQLTKKRILEQAKKKQINNYQINNSKYQNDIKISSIPSIPKKFTTRIYEELAPGILIMHQQDKSNNNQIGPTTYNANHKLGQKNTITHKINPQHKYRKIQQLFPSPEIRIPPIAEQLRNQKKQYKKSIIKSSNINKNAINPSDLCLEVIILRQKLLRAQQNPAPGQYYNQKYQSTFKQLDPQLLPEYQLTMGKQTRFKQQTPKDQPLGPGTYTPSQPKQKPGGFIPKQTRQLTNTVPSKKYLPGPGTYILQSSTSKQPSNPKGNYPPIFGSGCTRFYSSVPKINDTPGPGSYKIQNRNKNKCKFIKIKKQHLQSQIPYQPEKPLTDNNRMSLLDIHQHQLYRNQLNSSFHLSKDHKTNHYFTSKVQRFTKQKQKDISIGPGNYDIRHLSLIKKSYNKNRNSYLGSKNTRFDQTIIRPNIGPGTYYKSSLDIHHN